MFDRIFKSRFELFAVSIRPSVYVVILVVKDIAHNNTYNELEWADHVL